MQDRIVAKVVGLGFLSAMMMTGCTAQTGDEGASQTTEALPIHACLIGVSCAPFLPSTTHGVEVTLNGAGEASTTSPDATYAGSPDLYTLQADVPQNVTCAISVGTRCMRYTGTPVYPNHVVGAWVTPTFPNNLSCSDKLSRTWASISVEGFDAKAGKWIPLGNGSSYGNGSCPAKPGDWAFSLTASAGVSGIDLSKAGPAGDGLLALRVHGSGYFEQANGTWTAVPVSIGVEGPTVIH